MRFIVFLKYSLTKITGCFQRIIKDSETTEVME